MSFMTDDCVFEASAGPDVCGTRYAGREAVRAGFALKNSYRKNRPPLAAANG